MAKKKKKINLSPESQQLLREVGVLIESVRGDVRIVAEQHGGIRHDIDEIKKTLNSHTEMIGKLLVDNQIVKDTLEFIKQGLRKKVDYDEFSALERRVSLIERRVVK